MYSEKTCEKCKKLTIHDEDRCLDCNPGTRSWSDAMKAHNIQSTDIMEPTRHPATGEYYTSKSKFRATTRSLGYEEVGNEYAKGYDPSKERAKESQKKLEKRVSESFRENLNANRTKYRS